MWDFVERFGEVKYDRVDNLLLVHPVNKVRDYSGQLGFAGSVFAEAVLNRSKEAVGVKMFVNR